MAINGISTSPTSISPLLNNTQAPSARNADKQTQDIQDSTVVKLSAQAQQLSRAEAQKTVQGARHTENAETKPQETAEPVSTQFNEGESKGGRINAFA